MSSSILKYLVFIHKDLFFGTLKISRLFKISEDPDASNGSGPLQKGSGILLESNLIQFERKKHLVI